MLLTLQLALQALGFADTPDSELVQMFLSTRNERYFGELYRRYSPRVYGKCVSMLNVEAEAHDAVQDVFERALLRISTFRADASFSTWVYAIANNHCIDRIRRRSRRRVEPLPEQETANQIADNTAEADWLEEQSPQAIAYILDKLSEIDRAALLLRYMDGLELEELSQALNIGTSATKMRLKRARDRAKIAYQEWATAQDMYAV